MLNRAASRKQIPIGYFRCAALTAAWLRPGRKAVVDEMAMAEQWQVGHWRMSRL